MAVSPGHQCKCRSAGCPDWNLTLGSLVVGWVSEHLPDRFLDQAAPFEMYNDAGLNAAHIVQTALLAIGADKTAAELASA